jgi:hypothetical protein
MGTRVLWKPKKKGGHVKGLGTTELLISCGAIIQFLWPEHILSVSTRATVIIHWKGRQPYPSRPVTTMYRSRLNSQAFTGPITGTWVQAPVFINNSRLNGWLTMPLYNSHVTDRKREREGELRVRPLLPLRPRNSGMCGTGRMDFFVNDFLWNKVFMLKEQ